MLFLNFLSRIVDNSNQRKHTPPQPTLAGFVLNFRG